MALEQPYKRNICFFSTLYTFNTDDGAVYGFYFTLSYLAHVPNTRFDIIYIFRVPDRYFSCSIETLMAEMECTFPRGCRLRSTAGVVMGLHILPITGQVTTAREEGMVLMITVPGNHTVSS